LWFATNHWDGTRIRLRAEQAVARELAEKAAKEQEVEAAARAAAAKEAECVSKRVRAVNSAKKAEREAGARLEECRTAHAKKVWLQPFLTSEQACKSAHEDVDAAKNAVTAAGGRVCSTGSLKAR
jgi:hypothetical protein